MVLVQKQSVFHLLLRIFLHVRKTCLCADWYACMSPDLHQADLHATDEAPDT